VDGTHVERAVGELVRVLQPQAGRDWRVPAGGLAWTCWQTAAHVAHDLLAYAGQVAGRPADGYLPLDLVVRDTATPAQVLAVVRACGRLLHDAIARAEPGAHGWHWGPCDTSGFAAMGVNETLMHTHDITQGLGVPWLPPADLCAAVLRRLFPDAPPGDSAQALLWCTGRAEFAGRPRRTSWVVKAARPQP
jgi:hypothetical protein